jgi:serine/threonine protein kinase
LASNEEEQDGRGQQEQKCLRQWLASDGDGGSMVHGDLYIVCSISSFPLLVHLHLAKKISQLNVLMDNDGNARLADFGLSDVLSSINMATPDIAEHARYQAPEIFLAEEGNETLYTVRTDIFSFSMVGVAVRVFQACLSSSGF